MKSRLCKCGCGNKIPTFPSHRYTGIPDFIRGHHFRCLSPEDIKRKSLAGKRRTAEGRNAHFIGCRKGIRMTDQQKQELSERMKGKYAGRKRPDHSERMRDLAGRTEDWGMKNPKFRALALTKRAKGFVLGEKNGRFIDGRKSKPGYAAYLSSTRRARKLCQTPQDADPKKISELYEIAKKLSILTGEQYDVDHITPLAKGGLHHENNLRVITHHENIHKYTKIISISCGEAV